MEEEKRAKISYWYGTTVMRSGELNADIAYYRGHTSDYRRVLLNSSHRDGLEA
jgi:hypothetical protein